jgi:hypothetical protein
LRYDGAIEIAGQTMRGRAPLESGRTATIGEVSVTLEKIS